MVNMLAQGRRLPFRWSCRPVIDAIKNASNAAAECIRIPLYTEEVVL